MKKIPQIFAAFLAVYLRFLRLNAQNVLDRVDEKNLAAGSDIYHQTVPAFYTNEQLHRLELLKCAPLSQPL